MATVTKQQLIKQLSLQNRRPQQFYQVALREILKGIQQQLAKGNKEKIRRCHLDFCVMMCSEKALNPV